MPQIARILNSGMIGDDGSYGLKLSGNFFAASISSRAFFMLSRLCACAFDASAQLISRIAASLSIGDARRSVALGLHNVTQSLFVALGSINASQGNRLCALAMGKP